MIKLSEEAKQKYAKYVGPDGKLIINDSLPDELKETFQYFNDNNINILELNIDDTIFSEDDEEKEELLGADDNDDDEVIDENIEDDFDQSTTYNDIIEDDSSVDIDGLNNLFG